jgi:hypothetical protein
MWRVVLHVSLCGRTRIYACRSSDAFRNLTVIPRTPSKDTSTRSDVGKGGPADLRSEQLASQWRLTMNSYEDHGFRIFEDAYAMSHSRECLTLVFDECCPSDGRGVRAEKSIGAHRSIDNRPFRIQRPTTSLSPHHTQVSRDAAIFDEMSTKPVEDHLEFSRRMPGSEEQR